MPFEFVRLVLPVAVVLSQAVTASTASGQTAPDQAAPVRTAAAVERRVTIAIVGAPPAIAPLSLSLADAMRRLGIGVETRRASTVFARGNEASGELPRPLAGEPPMTARIWIDLSQREGATLYVADDQRERVFVRRFETPAGVDEVAREQLVLAASSSIEAILSGHLIGVARQDYEASLRPQLPPAAQLPVEPQSRSSGSLSGAYSVSWLGPGELAHGLALGVKLERPHFGIGLWGQGRFPVLVGDSGSESITVRLATLGFRYRVWYSLALSERVSLLPGLGVGGDFTQISPRGGGPTGPRATEPHWAADALLQGYLGATYRARGWSLTGALGVDFATAPVRYTVETARGMTDVFVPFLVRPFIELELATKVLP